jgi:hypothetical protein
MELAIGHVLIHTAASVEYINCFSIIPEKLCKIRNIGRIYFHIAKY